MKSVVTLGKRVFNVAGQKETRRFLRSHLSEAEVKLWQHLKDRKLEGIKFRRQHGVGPFIVDFYAPALRVAIEIDGVNHTQGIKPALDAERTAYLESLGITVVRFSNDDVLHGVTEVLLALQEIIIQRKNVPKADTSSLPRRL